MRPHVPACVLSMVLGAVVVASPLSAQQSVASQPPQVVVIGRGEVSAEPDRARVEFGVETRAATATAATTENRRRMRAVLDTIQRLGIEAKQVQTSNLQVNPEMVYPGQGQPPKVAGYVARNSVRVAVERLDLTGALVDAAIGRGASNVRGLSFYSSRTEELRREALSKAVKSARLDAEAIAAAAGVQLGALLEITSFSMPSGPVPMEGGLAMRAAMAAPTPVSVGEMTVVETVTVRWSLKQ